MLKLMIQVLSLLLDEVNPERYSVPTHLWLGEIDGLGPEASQDQVQHCSVHHQAALDDGHLQCRQHGQDLGCDGTVSWAPAGQ